MFQSLRLGQPDVLLIDVEMPGAGGIELCEQLRKRRLAIPVVLMTGCVTLDVEDAAFRAGARAVVAKPFSASQLADVVSWVLSESRAATDC